jgi:hypothetical protein
LGNICGAQLYDFATTWTNNCFEQRQLWGVALESKFGKLLSEATLGGSFSSFGEQLWGAALRSSVEQKL